MKKCIKNIWKRIKNFLNEEQKRIENYMSKYTPLWEFVKQNGSASFVMTFEEIQNVLGMPIDHSFLKYKKELAEYGYEVGKISMKGQTVTFHQRA